MPQFDDLPDNPELCVRYPHIPITQIAERHGSGKMTLNKSGASGTRVWQCPWFLYPAFCDFLLGRVGIDNKGPPDLKRPDVFSPCYPWLYCQEASVEGEDLLGVDGSLRAFYRRAIVTAKYQPLEMNNSIHINSQMLTIPNTQYVFIGTDPSNLVGFQQLFSVEIQGGPPNGGTFQLGLANDNSATGFTVPAISAGKPGNGVPAPTPPEKGVVWSDDIAYDASENDVLKAVRKALGKNDTTTVIGGVTYTVPNNDDPGICTVTGPEGKPGAAGPWLVTLNVPTVQTMFAKYKLDAPANGVFINYGGHTRGIDPRKPQGSTTVFGLPVPGGTQPIDDWWAGGAGGIVSPAHTDLFSLEWSGKFTSGTFMFQITFEDGSINRSEPVDAASYQPADIKNVLRGALENYKVSGARQNNKLAADIPALWNGFYGGPPPELASTINVATLVETGWLPGVGAITKVENKKVDSPFKAAQVEELKFSPVRYGGDIDRACAVYLSQPYRNGGLIEPVRYVTEPGGASRPVYSGSLSQMASNNGNEPLVMYFGFHTLVAGFKVKNVEIVWTGSANTSAEQTAAPPTVLVKKFDPYLANRLDQNVGKVVPMGEITFQRHQVLGSDMIYLLSVVGAVNMFTFLGFPPWTLLLTGIEAKQTRLPNGTPCYDMTFKFAFNPYTHQAIFRPAYMRWEFVRGVLISKLPENVAVPTRPLDPARGGRAKLNNEAISQAYAVPEAPRIIPLIINPYTGSVVDQGAKSVIGNIPTTQELITNISGNLSDTFNLLFGAEAIPEGGTTADAKAMQFGAGASAAQTPNGNAPTSSTASPPTPDIGTLFGQEPANAKNVIQLLRSMSDVKQDPNNEADDPTAAWGSQSNILGNMIAQSITRTKGTADDDRKAYDTGRAADIKQAKLDGAKWLSALDNGANFTGSGGTGNLENDLAYARAAHACGAKLSPSTRTLIGLPPEKEATPDSQMGAGPAPPPAPGPGGFFNDAANAIKANPALANNVGGADSIARMSTRVFDLGLIYPIVDMTPILFLQ